MGREKPTNEKLKKLGRALLTGVKIALKSLLLLPIPIFMVWFSRSTAEIAALQVNQFERDCAKALLAGEALSGFDQLNERLILSQLIANLEQPFDTVAIGSSRILQMTAEHAGSDSFYNCGLSGADYRDIVNVFYQFELAGKLPKNLIIGLDPWILNSDPNKLHRFSDNEMFEAFVTTRLGWNTGYVPPVEEAEDPAKLLSPVTFRQNLEFTLTDDTKALPPPLAEGDWYDQPSQLKLPNGTTLYPKAWREADQGEVTLRAMTEMQTFLNMDDFLAPSEELCLLFHQFVQYARSQGVNVTLVMLPYHPIVYTYASENAGRYPGFFLCEPWFIAYAKMYDLPLYGSYNPYVTGSEEQDYYDGLHVRGEVIPSIFPGLGEVAARQAAGEPAMSGWNTGERPRVLYATAERLVRQRNEIPQSEPTRAAADVSIRGELCWQMERMSGEGDDAIVLARYAVSRRQGVVYRFDTDLNQWVYDVRFP